MKRELLAPAGSLDICKAVIHAGADAVYLGGSKYGARAFAQNFSESEVLEALDFAHLYGRRIMLTVNTLLKNREMGRELYEYLKPFYEHGLDAVIVQDYGVFQFVRKYFPELPVHASTQMSVANVQGARFLQKQGAARIVTARELSLPEIRRIYDETGVEIESFIHGALCYCYSGQCLMSSLFGGRSGNRGRCAQPCRLSYQVTDETGKVYHRKEKYPLSPKDLCAVELLPQLCEAGIYSFKIEGRMKSLEYAAGVTGIYRKYLDLYETDPRSFHVEERDRKTLLQLGNRNGFTRGYYEMRNGRSMMTLTDSSHSSGNAKEAYRPAEPGKITLNGRAVLREGEAMRLTLWKTAGGNHGPEPGEMSAVTVTGQTVQAAQSRPLMEEDVRSRLSKTGDTPFELSDLTLELGEGCFVPVGQLNGLRRSGLEKMEEQLLAAHRRELPPGQPEFSDAQAAGGRRGENALLDVWVSDAGQLKEVLRYSFVDMVSLNVSAQNQLLSAEQFAEFLEACRDQIHKAGKQAAFCLPQVFRQDSSGFYSREVCRKLLASFDRIWVRSYDELGFALDDLGMAPERIGLDERLYVFSGEAKAAFGKSGLSWTTASPELNQKELAHLENGTAEFCVYGLAPLMVSAQCVYKNYDGCRKQQPEGSRLYLTDRYFKKFFIKRNCRDCYNVIYNSQPLYLIHQAEAVQRLGFGAHRICFVTEGRAEIERILLDYQKGFRQGKRLEPPAGRDSFTTGHFRRGVD